MTHAANRVSYVLLRNVTSRHLIYVTKCHIYILSVLLSLEKNKSSVNSVYNDNHRGPKIVAVVDRGSLFIGHLCANAKSSKWDHKMLVVEYRQSL
jgi:hypothetical protein